MPRSNKKTKSSVAKKVYSKGRVKRGPAPLQTLKRTTYRKALPELRRDFGDRCAYCMRHIGTETEMQIDHFDPRKKKEKLQVYANLFLADAHCNGAKKDTWPTKEESEQGCRFLNCCDEEDYGNVIFEKPDTNELVGTTPAAVFHIETIDLNDPDLIKARRYRAEIFEKLKFIKKKSANTPEIASAADKLCEMAERLIPDIPAPPHYWTTLP